jgi:hypothetical protein
MKQLTISYDTGKVTIERVKKVCVLINAGMTPSAALRNERMGKQYLQLMREVGIIKKVGSREWEAVKHLRQDKFNQFVEAKNRYYENIQASKADTDMLGLVNMPKSAPIKKEAVLPWWKRFLLYLLNH